MNTVRVIQRQCHTQGKAAPQPKRRKGNPQKRCQVWSDGKRNQASRRQQSADRQPATTIMRLAQSPKDGVAEHEGRCEAGEKQPCECRRLTVFARHRRSPSQQCVKEKVVECEK